MWDQRLNLPQSILKMGLVSDGSANTLLTNVNGIGFGTGAIPMSSSTQLTDVNDTGNMVLIFCHIICYLVSLRCLASRKLSAGSQHPRLGTR